MSAFLGHRDGEGKESLACMLFSSGFMKGFGEKITVCRATIDSKEYSLTSRLADLRREGSYCPVLTPARRK